MQVDQLSRLMQLQALQGTSNSSSNLGTGNENSIFNNLLGQILENQSNEKATTSNAVSTADASTKKSSINSVTKELELMMQLQALQSISSSYSSIDSIANGDSDSNSGNGLGTNNYAYQIMNSLSQSSDSSGDSSLSNFGQNTNDSGSNSFL